MNPTKADCVSTASLKSSISSSSFFETVLYRLLHAPTGTSGLRMGALFRIGFALIVLYDRITLIQHMEFFFDPNVGVLPPFSAMSNETLQEIFYDDEYHTPMPPITSIFRYFEDAQWDPILVNVLHYGSLVSALFLLVGIYPKFMAIFIHISIVSFQNRSINMIYDHQDMLLRVMSFYIIFLPMHYWSIPTYMTLRKQQNTQSNPVDRRTDSTPIVPFRLIQWQMALAVFPAAGIGKLSYPIWTTAGAMYNVVQQQDFFGGFVAPDWIYNDMGVLRIMTYASLILECTCSLFIWPNATRKYVVVSMLLFHLGIDMAMNLHIFQWLSMLGWCMFFVQTEENEAHKTSQKAGQEGRSSESMPGVSLSSTSCSKYSRWKYHVIYTIVPLIWLVILVADTAPVYDFYRLTENYEETLWPMISTIESLQNVVATSANHLLLEPLGLSQKTYNMYCSPSLKNRRIIAKISFEDRSDEEYWTSTEWTKLSVIEKKSMYRHVLFWNALHDEPIMQHAVCKRLAKKYEIHGTVSKIVLKRISVSARPFHSIRKKSFSDPAIQNILTNMKEQVLYICVYNTTTTLPGEGYVETSSPSDPEDDFDYIWDPKIDGIWWDDVFYRQHYDKKDEFLLMDYPYSDDDLNNPSNRESEGSATDEGEL